jgi:hypothetical protein
MKKHGGWFQLGKILIRPAERFPAILTAEPSSSKLWGSVHRKWWILSMKYFFQTCRILLHATKFLRHRFFGFTSPLKEFVLIFITLKNPPPQTGLNPRTLGLMARTLNHYTTKAITIGDNCQRLSHCYRIFKGLLYYTILYYTEQDIQLTDCCGQGWVSSSSSGTAGHCCAHSPHDQDCRPSWGCWHACTQSAEGHSGCQWSQCVCTSSPADQAYIPDSNLNTI